MKKFIILFSLFIFQIINAQIVSEITVPAGAISMNVELYGGRGGRAEVEAPKPFSSGTVNSVALGGQSMGVNIKLNIGNGASQIPVGSNLRLIKGTQGEDRINYILLGSDFATGGGGGGSALLVKKPNITTWEIVAVSGGGGGAYAGMVAYIPVDRSNGVNGDYFSSYYPTFGSYGSGNNGGQGGQGGGVNEVLSGGGGGAFSDGSANILPFCSDGGRGKLGFPDGAPRSGCFISGGSGFGSGGGSYGASGGGGGYNGGGGGGEFSGGGAGSGYLNPNYNYLVRYCSLSSEINGDVKVNFEFTECNNAQITLNPAVTTKPTCVGANDGSATVSANFTLPNNATTT